MILETRPPSRPQVRVVRSAACLRRCLALAGIGRSPTRWTPGVVEQRPRALDGGEIVVVVVVVVVVKTCQR